MKRADKIVSTQSKNSSNQSEDLQSFLKKMLEELSSKYNASGPTETLEGDLPLKDGTLIASFPPKRKMPVSRQWVSVSVPWGYEEATLIIGPINWKRISEGKPVSLTSRGWNDGEGFTLQWGFNTTAQYPLWVSYGDADAYRGSLSRAMVTCVNKPTKK